MFGVIIDFFSNIINWCLNIFSKIWEWLVDLLYQAIEVHLEPLEPLVPDLSSFWDKLQILSPYTAWANQWIALEYGLSLLVSYLIFISVMITIKLFVKLFIPMVG